MSLAEMTASGPRERAAALWEPNPGWVKIGSLLAFLYMLFGLVFVGIPGLSRGGIISACLAGLWAAVGLVTKQARFPASLSLAVAFYLYVVASGFLVDPYPIDYVLQVTTIWVGGIALAIFVANGMEMRVILLGFAIVFVANMAAIAVGYDGYTQNVAQSAGAVVGDEIDRFSGLAGQQNLLVALTTAPLFLLFLRGGRGIPLIVYLALIAAAVAITILSGSRSAIFITLAFLVFGAWFLIESALLRKAVTVLVVVAAIAALYFSLDPNAILKIEKSQLGEVTVVERMIQSIDGVDLSANVRRDFMGKVWEPLAAKPFTGHGPDMFDKVTGAGTYAHNSFVEIGVNFGLIGLSLWYGMYLVSLVGMARAPYKIGAIAALGYLLLMDNWYVTYLERPLVLVLCLLLVYTGRSLLRRSRRAPPKIVLAANASG